MINFVEMFELEGEYSVRCVEIKMKLPVLWFTKYSYPSSTGIIYYNLYYQN